MAMSKFEYVKTFEQQICLLKNCWIVVRVDGHGFHNFTARNKFQKPNDVRGLHVMNSAAQVVMKEFDDIVFAYGHSDEYSFIFKPSTTVYQRRQEKISSTIVSLFTSAYVTNWRHNFDQDIDGIASFDSRCVLYPNMQTIRDYISWRQADCHINNLYNTAFWELVQNKASLKNEQEAEEILKKTDSGGKNELLFQFGVNYNEIPQIFRKGSILAREQKMVEEVRKSGKSVEKKRSIVELYHCDVIGESFWNTRANLLQ